MGKTIANNYKKRLSLLKKTNDKKEVLKLYHDIEEYWFKLKRFNDVSCINHKDTAIINSLYDEICELVVLTKALAV